MIKSISQAGIDLIVRFEAIRLNAYLCPANVWTIGIGSTYYEDGSKIKQGDIITKERAYQIFKNTIQSYEKAVYSLTRDDIDQNQFDALVSFSYNVGIGALTKSTLLKLLNKNPFDRKIKMEFLKWNKANGKELKGLTKRRISESELYFKN